MSLFHPLAEHPHSPRPPAPAVGVPFDPATTTAEEGTGTKTAINQRDPFMTLRGASAGTTQLVMANAEKGAASQPATQQALEVQPVEPSEQNKRKVSNLLVKLEDRDRAVRDQALADLVALLDEDASLWPFIEGQLDDLEPEAAARVGSLRPVFKATLNGNKIQVTIHKAPEADQFYIVYRPVSNQQVVQYGGMPEFKALDPGSTGPVPDIKITPKQAAERVVAFVTVALWEGAVKKGEWVAPVVFKIAG